MSTSPLSPDPHGHVGAEVEVPHLETDETVPPRPEEEIADALRQAPDPTPQEGSGSPGAHPR